MEATVAERGQITLPKAVRDALGLTKGTQLKVELEEALNHADSRDGLALKIRLAEGADSPMPEAFDASNY